MNRSVWKSPYYKKILQILSFSNFGVLFLALLSLYIAFYIATSRYLDSINQHFLNNVAANVHFQINRSQENALNIYLSYSGTEILASEAPTNDNFVRSLKELDSFITKDPVTHSVYLLNTDTDKIITLGSDLSRLDKSMFNDADTLSRMLDIQQESFVPFAHSVPNSSYHNVHNSYVYTYIYRMSSNNILAVNLNIDKLFALLKTNPSAYNTAKSNFIIFSGTDIPIYANITSDSLVEADSALISSAIRDNDGKNNLAVKIGGVKYRLNSHYNADSNLTYVSLIENADIFKSFHYHQIMFVSIVVAGGLLALVLSVQLSKTVYVPIGKMHSLLSSTDDPDMPPQNNEIDFITQSIIENTKSLETLYEYKSNTMDISQLSLIKKQLLYGAYSDEEFIHQCEKKELAYSYEADSILIYARWYASGDDKPAGIRRDSDHALLNYAIANVFHELVKGAQSIYDIPFENEGMAFWCNFDTTPDDSSLKAAMRSIQCTFKQYFGLQLSFFISDKIKRPEDLYPAMQKLEKLSDYQYFYADGCIHHSGDIDPEQRISELCPLPELSDLEKALRSAQWDHCALLLDPFFQQLYNYSYESARASLSMFASKLITLMKKITAGQPGLPECAHHAFFRDVLAAPNLTIAQCRLQEPLRDIVDTLASPGNDTINLLAEEVQRYLEQNYHTYNISSKSIALHHHISVPYLNRIFKQKTGDTIAGYIKKLRLEGAKHMLTATNLPVETVARKVGFENTKYFYLIFKNEFGESPSNYRISHSLISSKNS